MPHHSPHVFCSPHCTWIVLIGAYAALKSLGHQGFQVAVANSVQNVAYLSNLLQEGPLSSRVKVRGEWSCEDGGLFPACLPLPEVQLCPHQVPSMILDFLVDRVPWLLPMCAAMRS